MSINGLGRVLRCGMVAYQLDFILCTIEGKEKGQELVGERRQQARSQN